MDPTTIKVNFWVLFFEDFNSIFICLEVHIELLTDYQGNDLMRSYKAELRKYRSKESAVGKKKSSKRENDTLAMLDSFQKKLTSLAQFASYDEEEAAKGETADAEDKTEEKEEEEFDDDDISW